MSGRTHYDWLYKPSRDRQEQPVSEDNQKPTMVVYVGCTEDAEWLNLSLNNGAEIVGRHVLDDAVVYELSGAREISPAAERNES